MGSLLTAGLNLGNGYANRVFTAEQNALDRQQELYLAGNKIQLQTQDMLNAGLNPASLGGTAAEGNKAGASSATAAATPKAYLGDAVQAAASSAMKAALLAKFGYSANKASSATSAAYKIKQETEAINRLIRSRKR